MNKKQFKIVSKIVDMVLHMVAIIISSIVSITLILAFDLGSLYIGKVFLLTGISLILFYIATRAILVLLFKPFILSLKNKINQKDEEIKVIIPEFTVYVNMDYYDNLEQKDKIKKI